MPDRGAIRTLKEKALNGPYLVDHRSSKGNGGQPYQSLERIMRERQA